MRYNLRFDNDRLRSIVLLKTMDREEAFAGMCKYNAAARAKGLQVTKLEHKGNELGAWGHITYKNVGLPPEDTGRLCGMAYRDTFVR